MKKIELASLGLCMLLISCMDSNEKKNGTKEVVNYETINVPDVDSKFILPENPEYYDYIKLELKENKIISSVDKIIFNDQQIYILDKLQNKILLFTSEGSSITEIDFQGKGPLEYLTLTDFIVDQSTKNLELLDRAGKKILLLNGANEVYETLDIPIYCEKFFKTSENKYLLYAGNQVNSVLGEQSYNIYFSDNKLVSFNGFLPVTDSRQNMQVHEPFIFSNYDDQILFSLPFDNNLYSTGKNYCSVKYKLSFGDSDIPMDIFEPLENADNNERHLLTMKILNQITNGNYAFSIFSVFENKSFLFFQYRKKGNLYSVLYNKDTTELLTGIQVRRGDVNLMGQPIALNENNQLVTVLFPHEIIGVESSYLNPKLRKIVSSLEMSDNPILQYIQF